MQVHPSGSVSFVQKKDGFVGHVGEEVRHLLRKECHLLLWPGGYLSFLISMHFINYGNHLFNESLTVCK